MSLHDDALAILLPERVAHAVDLAKIVRLLELSVLVAILHDLLREAATDASERHQRLHVGSVDVDLVSTDVRGTGGGVSERRRGRDDSEQQRERDQLDHHEPPGGWCTARSRSSAAI